MNHSLIGADRVTHLKIVTVAIITSVLVEFAAHASHSFVNSSNNSSNIVAVPSPADAHSFANVDRVTVCRFNAM